MRKVVKPCSKSLVNLMLFVIVLLSNGSVAAAEQKMQQQNTDFPIHVIQKTENDAESIVMVFMADGYTEQQQEQFIQDATVRAYGLLRYEPFKSYANKINIYAVMSVSEEFFHFHHFPTQAELLLLTKLHTASVGSGTSMCRKGKG